MPGKYSKTLSFIVTIKVSVSLRDIIHNKRHISACLQQADCVLRNTFKRGMSQLSAADYDFCVLFSSSFILYGLETEKLLCSLGV